MRDRLGVGQHQSVGGGMDQQPELVGHPFVAGFAVGGEVQFVRLNQVLGLSSGAINLVIERLQPCTRSSVSSMSSYSWGQLRGSAVLLRSLYYLQLQCP